MSEAPTILVVEDNPANQMLVGLVLEREGMKVDLAATASEVLERLDSSPPALILMDVHLQGGDGLELTRHIKSDPRTAAIPIVALTADAMSGDRETTLRAGCDGYIAKPIDTRTFAEEIRRYL